MRGRDLLRDPPWPLRPREIGWCAQVACLLEVSAEKPGNVTPAHDFPNASYVDFLASAAAVGPALATAGRAGVGRTVLRAVRATRRVVRSNTNLGLILLFAPLACAASRPGHGPVRERLARVLESLTLDDAHRVYRAIRLARPGGLGGEVEHDVRRAPEVDLRAAMRSARDRDAIAAEYASGFEVTLGVAYPALLRELRRLGDLREAAVQVQIELMAMRLDTLIARKAGSAAAAESQRRATEALRLGGTTTGAGRAALADLDAWLRSDGNRMNPGTTADMVGAALFLSLLLHGPALLREPDAGASRNGPPAVRARPRRADARLHPVAKEA